MQSLKKNNFVCHFLRKLQAVPCNQFAYQEPAANATELYNSMAYVRPGFQKGYKFVPKFPLTKKFHVNGKKAHPVMVHLRVIWMF